MKDNEKHIKENLIWAMEELDRIQRYEAQGKKPVGEEKKLTLTTIINTCKTILSCPEDRERKIWERTVRRCMARLFKNATEGRGV